MPEIGIPDHVARSACVLVQLDGHGRARAEAPPVALEDLPAHLERWQAGADEVILVASPINERSVRTLGDRLGDLLV